MPEPSATPPLDPAHGRTGMPAAEADAINWVLRLQNGLTLEEDIALADWLAADPAHAIAFRRCRETWERFAPLAATSLAPAASGATLPSAGQEAPGPRSRAAGIVATLLGLAACMAFVLISIRADRHTEADALGLPPPCEQLTLADGSVVELNRGARVTVQFDAARRHLRLEHGEANFTVAHEPSRPFIVDAGGLEVQAVGTAFNVRVANQDVDVLVTEGRVKIAPTSASRPAAPAPARALPSDATGPTMLAAGQGALVERGPAAASPQVRTFHPREIEARLAWQPRLLEFDDAPLSAIVGEFNRRNPVRLVIRDPAVADRRMSLSFRSDNLAGFVRLLESSIGVRAQRIDEEQIALVRP